MQQNAPNPSRDGKPSAPAALAKSFRRAVIMFVPTANAVLVTVQSVLAQPPFATALSPWVYVYVNAAAVIAAAAVRLGSTLKANRASLAGDTHGSSPRSASGDAESPPE